ncbi:MAG: cAMP-activated global transcriptional regulator [Pseudomonadota bacterium]
MTQQPLTPDLKLLAALGKQESFKKGALIFKDGDHGDGFYILLEGRVRAFGSAISGKEINYGYVSAGEYFGELTLDGGNRSANVEAVEHSVCAVVSCAQLQAFMTEHPRFGTEMLHTVIHRARQSTDNARNIALMDVYSRLRRAIDKLTPDMNTGIHITHSELAADVGASREMVSKLLKDLEVGGYIKVQSRQLSRLKALPERW